MFANLAQSSLASFILRNRRMISLASSLNNTGLADPTSVPISLGMSFLTSSTSFFIASADLLASIGLYFASASFASRLSFSRSSVEREGPYSSWASGFSVGTTSTPPLPMVGEADQMASPE